MIEYRGTQSLASAEGLLITTPAARGITSSSWLTVTSSPKRRLVCAQVKAPSAITQVVSLWIRPNGGADDFTDDKLVVSEAIAAKTDWAYVPPSDLVIGAGEDFVLRVDDNTSPAITVTMVIQTEEA